MWSSHFFLVSHLLQLQVWFHVKISGKVPFLEFLFSEVTELVDRLFEADFTGLVPCIVLSHSSILASEGFEAVAVLVISRIRAPILSDKLGESRILFHILRLLVNDRCILKYSSGCLICRLATHLVDAKSLH